MIQTHTLDLMARMLETRADLSADDRAAILALPHTVREVEAQTYLTREGESPNMCAVILSGFAYRQKLTGEGGRQIVSLHIPGDMLDLQHLFLDTADHNIQMLTRARVALIPSAALRTLVRARSGVAQAVTVAILAEGSIFREWVLNVGRRDGRTRLAHLLCELAVRLDARRLSDEMGYELPMTQEQLGDTLGLTPVHINRLIRVLETEGHITRTRRHVSFPNWEAMRDLADFNSRYLHLHKQRV